MADINFVRMKCNTNTYTMCEKCKREFVLSVNEIATIMKNGNDKAVIQTTNEGYFHPLCGGQARTIQTDVLFDDLLKLINAKYADLGDISLKTTRVHFDTAEGS